MAYWAESMENWSEHIEMWQLELDYAHYGDIAICVGFFSCWMERRLIPETPYCILLMNNHLIAIVNKRANKINQ